MRGRGYVPLALLPNQLLDLLLLLRGRGVTHDVDIVSCVARSDLVVVMRGSIVFDNAVDAKVDKRRVHCLLVYLEGLGGVLHASGWLKIGTNGELMARCPVPFLNLREGRMLPLATLFRRVLVGMVKMVDIPDVAIFSARTRLCDAENHRLARVVIDIFEQCANTKVFCVFVTHLHVGSAPSHPLCLAPPA